MLNYPNPPPLNTLLTTMGCSLSKLPSTTTNSTSSALNTLRTLHSAAASAQRKFARRTNHHNHHPALLARLTRILRDINTFVGRDSDRFFTYNCRTGGYRAKNVGALTHEAARLTTALQVTVRDMVRAGGPAYTLSDGSRIERLVLISQLW